MIVLIISGIICLVALAFFIAGAIDGDDGCMGISAVVVIFTVIIGFGLIGGLAPSGGKKTAIFIPDSVTKGEYEIFVKIEGNTLSTTDARLVATETDKIRVKKIMSLNSYGGVVENKFEIVLAD